MFADYYSLTKSGLVYGNLLTVIGGFAIAAKYFSGAGMASLSGVAVFGILIATLIGAALVMASGCVVNNIIDRDIDDEMMRTHERALVAGRISVRAAAIFGVLLGVVGFAILAIWTNWLAAAAAVFGWFAYVVLYSLWAKRGGDYGTVIGSLAGATPPVIGYLAAGDRFNIGTVILFFMLVFWQMPHFFAIGIYRFDDYAVARIPILPVTRGIRTTKIEMLIYIIAFTFAAVSLTGFGYAGWIYNIIALLLGLGWLALCIKGFWNKPAADKRWARHMFFLSLIVLTVLFIAMTLTALF